MPTAIWNGAVIADARDDEVEIVENNVYFPLDRVRQEYLRPSSTHTTCHWKGIASYYTLEANGQTNPDAAWTYRAPYEAAQQIKDRVAFWKGVEVR